MADDKRVPRRTVDPTAVIAAIQEHFDALELPSWPVYGLADGDRPGWLCGAGEDADGLHAMRIDYRQPGDRERLIVQTVDQPQQPNLAAVFDALAADEDEGEPLSLAADESRPTFSPDASDTEVVVDEERVPAIVARDQQRTVWCAQIGRVACVVAARQLTLNEIRLRRVTDLRPLQLQRRTVVKAFLAK